jgi:glycosyltransferase involved in cell wall biosynthesis
MACGCAFVGTDSGGVRDYATDGDTALLSAPGDRDGLLQNLIRITENALSAAIFRAAVQKIFTTSHGR